MMSVPIATAGLVDAFTVLGLYVEWAALAFLVTGALLALWHKSGLLLAIVVLLGLFHAVIFFPWAGFVPVSPAADYETLAWEGCFRALAWAWAALWLAVFLPVAVILRVRAEPNPALKRTPLAGHPGSVLHTHTRPESSLSLHPLGRSTEFTSMHTLLKGIRARPSRFLGSTKHPFTRLAAFLDGYSFGYGDGRVSCGAPGENGPLVPIHFTEFVAAQLGLEQLGGAGWSTFIRRESADEQAAFELFFTLRERHDRLHSSAA